MTLSSNKTCKRYTAQKNKKLALLKKQVENADLYKFVINKIMITQK